MAGRLARWMRKLLQQPVDNATLALFRISFGILIAAELVEAWSERVELMTVRPIRFPYTGFEWLSLLPPEAAVFVHAGLVACCVCIAFGYQFRVAAILFVIGYSYSFLLDRANFNNHFYLICLLGGWLALGDAHRRWSVDARRSSWLASETVPRWQVLGPAIQMAIPYVFGGLAKINQDWLRGEPMRAQLWWGLAEHPLYAPIVSQPWAGVVFAWAGMLFDLFIVPALLWPKTRLFAILAMVMFHVTNMQMFNIGIFPWLGIASIVLFLPTSAVSEAIDRVFGRAKRRVAAMQQPSCGIAQSSPLVTGLFIAWLVWQCVLPLRHHMIPGNVGWTREGFYFAWTMKLDIKSCFLSFHICNPDTGECLAIDHDRDLTAYQRYWVPREPQGIVRYAKFLRERAIREGLANPVIVCDSVCALNGRPYQFMVDPSLDPSELTIPFFGHAPWIVPLNESAPIGNYQVGAAKEEAVLAVIHEARLERKIFPERLRGKRIVDITPPEQIAR